MEGNIRQRQMELKTGQGNRVQREGVEAGIYQNVSEMPNWFKLKVRDEIDDNFKTLSKQNKVRFEFLTFQFPKILLK